MKLDRGRIRIDVVGNDISLGAIFDATSRHERLLWFETEL